MMNVGKSVQKVSIMLDAEWTNVYNKEYSGRPFVTDNFKAMFEVKMHESRHITN